MMKKTFILIALIPLLSAGCSTLSERSRLKSFSKTVDAYERALRFSDYDLAAKYLDPSTSGVDPDVMRLKNFKIVEYKITHVDVSENDLEIKQEVELQYFRLNGNILHNAHDQQTWRYKPEDKIWLLQTGLPKLEP